MKQNVLKSCILIGYDFLPILENNTNLIALLQIILYLIDIFWTDI